MHNHDSARDRDLPCARTQPARARQDRGDCRSSQRRAVHIWRRHRMAGGRVPGDRYLLRPSRSTHARVHRVMRKLWTERRSSHQGEFVNFASVLSYPKPVSEKGVPVWFGGESGPALRRVAEYGDGWIGFNLLPDQAAAKIKRIEDLKRYRDAGVEEIALLSGRLGAEREMVAGIEQMALDFVEPAAKL